MNAGPDGTELAATGTGRKPICSVVVWLMLILLLCLSAPAWAAEMVTNGGFDGSTGWTFGGTGTPQYSEVQSNLTPPGVGSGSFQEQVLGRNKDFTGTASQSVSVASGSVINATTDISLYSMEQNNGFTAGSSVTITLRYQDATTVEIFSGTVTAGSAWTQIANATATVFPLTLSQNVNQITVSAQSSVGNDAAAQSDVFVDDVTVTYTAAATDNLTVTASTNVSTTAQPSQTDVQMMYMQLNSDAVGNGSCIVSDVTINDTIVTAVGTISNVQIHIDDDSNFLNGTLGSNTTGAWDGTSTVVDLTGIAEASRTVVAGTPKFIWVLYDIDPASATGIQAQAQVTDVGVLAPDNGPISGPWDSNIIDINTGLGCGGCHPNPMVDGASRAPATGGVVGDHTKHASAQGYDCELCHLATPATPRHRNTFVELRAAIGDVINARYDKDGNHLHDSSWDHTTTPVRGRCENNNCHGGINSLGDYGGPTGTGPQWGTNSADTCTFCHNANQTNAGGVANSYPNAASPFRSSADAGAHAVHMAGSSGLIGGGVVCADCHTVPAAINDAGHMDELGVAPYTQAPADVPFPVGSDAKLNSYAAAYDNNDLNMTCTVYCHSAYDAAAVATKGSNTIPKWTDDWSNYDGNSACSTACHLTPPQTATHDKGGAVYYALTECNPCHATTVTDALAMPTMGATHIDGTVDASGCTSCHGTDPKQYPPVSKWGTITTTADGVGAHVLHIEGTASLMTKENIEGTLEADWCAECHTTTRGAGGHDDGYPAEVAITNAVESAYGAVTEAFTAEGDADPDVGVGGSCVTYCHGGSVDGTNMTPSWGDNWTNYSDGGAGSCTDNCHGLPPVDATHSGKLYPGDCQTCHGDTVTSTIDPVTIVASFHINGAVDATGCTGCHGTDPKEYPPVAYWVGTADGNTADGVGAHVKHIEATVSLLTKEAIGGEADTTGYWCAECHTTTRGDSGHDDGYPAEIAFTNAIEAGYNTTTASFSAAGGGSSGPDDGTGGSCTVYCHGANMPNGDALGSNTTPAWTDTSTGCGFCHGFPPTPAGTHNGITLETECGGCHDATMTNGSAGITDKTLHINGTVQVTVSCTGCHNGGGPTAKLVSADSPHSNTATGMTCEDCHFADHGSRTTGTVGITWYATTMGTDYTADGKIYIKANGATTEAEACWACHVTQTPDVSEWNGSSAVYDYGSLPEGTLNWFDAGATWTSANFSYKDGVLTTHVSGTGEGSTHGTMGGAQAGAGVDQESEIGCTRCHDVHGINNNGVSTTSAPYLRGSWKASPYNEDGAPQSTTTYTAGTSAYSGTSSEGMPRESVAQTAQMGGYWIDQNSGSPANGTYATHAGLCTLCHGDGDSVPSEAADVTAIETAWSGHANSVAGGSGGGADIFSNSLRNGTGDWNTGFWMGAVGYVTPRNTKPYGGSLRNEDYTDGVAPLVANNPTAWTDYDWGATVDNGTKDTAYHKFTCSKCHNPHASRLPRLMVTNCLDVVHNTWDDQFTGDANWSNWTSATLDYSTKEFAYTSTAQNCHRYVGGQEAGWNSVTPW